MHNQLQIRSFWISTSPVIDDSLCGPSAAALPPLVDGVEAILGRPDAAGVAVLVGDGGCVGGRVVVLAVRPPDVDARRVALRPAHRPGAQYNGILLLHSTE